MFQTPQPKGNRLKVSLCGKLLRQLLGFSAPLYLAGLLRHPSSHLKMMFKNSEAVL